MSPLKCEPCSKHAHDLCQRYRIGLARAMCGCGCRQRGENATDAVMVVQRAFQHETTLNQPPEAFYEPSPGQMLDHVNHRVARKAIDVLRAEGLLLQDASLTQIADEIERRGGDFGFELAELLRHRYMQARNAHIEAHRGYIP